MDAIALLDGLGVDKFMVAGHDWGSNTAEALAIGWPDRVRRLAMLSTPPRLGGLPTPPFWHAQLQWYHWFMATRRGAEAVRKDRRGFAHVHWINWSPPGWFDEATFDRVAQSFDNPDSVDVTLHSYRARWDEAEPDPRSRWLDAKVKAAKALSAPAIYIQGELDGVNPPEAAKQVPDKFTGPFRAGGWLGCPAGPLLDLDRTEGDRGRDAILRLGRERSGVRQRRCAGMFRVWTVHGQHVGLAAVRPPRRVEHANCDIVGL